MTAVDAASHPTRSYRDHSSASLHAAPPGVQQPGASLPPALGHGWLAASAPCWRRAVLAPCWIYRATLPLTSGYVGERIILRLTVRPQVNSERTHWPRGTAYIGQDRQPVGGGAGRQVFCLPIFPSADTSSRQVSSCSSHRRCQVRQAVLRACHRQPAQNSGAHHHPRHDHLTYSAQSLVSCF